jgi:hypothetical protein
VGISANIPAGVRSLRDSGGDPAPDSEDSQMGSGIDCCLDDCCNSQSHLVLGYGWFFIDALMVMLLAVIYVSLTRRRSHWAEHERVEIMAAIQTHQK